MMITKLERPVLVLNKNWTAIGTAPLYKSINLLLSKYKDNTCKALVIDDACAPHTWEEWSLIKPNNEDESLHTIHRSFKIPEVIKLNKYDRLPREMVIFSRHNIFRRDEQKCQYCGIKPGSEELTIDHVIPKAHGGKTTWENCVLACVECNSIKGSFSLDQVRNKKFPTGMKLMRKPFRPKLKDFKMPLLYASWKNWLSESYWNVELENDNRL